MVVGIKPVFKMKFFDRSIITRNWTRINERPLAKAGALVRVIARGSIKRRIGHKRGKNQDVTRRVSFAKPSPVGSPPYSRRSGKLPPFKMIFNLPDKLGTSEIVGMVGFFGTKGPATPGLHEHGGMASRKVIRRTIMTRTDTRNRRVWKGFAGWQSEPRTETRVVRRNWSRHRQTVRYPKRPFMHPALIKARTKLPKFWRNSVRK